MQASTVHYVKTSDGCDIAYSATGEGPDFVLMPYLFNHLGRTNAAQDALAERLLGRFRVIRYDSRGMGLSSRGLDNKHSMAGYERDLEAVVERLKLRRFVLLAFGVFAHAGLRFAVNHPDRVRGLVLWRTSLAMQDILPEAFWKTLAEENWDLFLDSFLAGTMAGYTLTPETRRSGKESMKAAVTQPDWLLSVRAWHRSSVKDEAPRLRVPTLVLVDDRSSLMPADRASELAAHIPGSQLVVLGSDSGVGGTFAAIEAFVSGLRGHEDEVGGGSTEARPGWSTASVALTARQIDVLSLLAKGKTTREIARTLVLSERTVERHIADVYAKIGARNRSEATAYAMSRLSVRS
jgi:pimeloyl-ACP methyl ester carboxylesterase/DNA-binding CsgD family transcriptional regulator